MSARARLAAAATAAGYAPATLTLIADATLPRDDPGARLSESALGQIRLAVEVLAQAGHPAADLPAIVAHYRDR